MFRVTLAKAITGTNRCLILTARASSTATPAKTPEKIEVFVDDKSILVDPGTTVLQASLFFSLRTTIIQIKSSKNFH